MSAAPEEKRNTWAFVFFKEFQHNSDMHLDFKKWLQVFLLYLVLVIYSSIIFLLTNRDTMVLSE